MALFTVFTEAYCRSSSRSVLKGTRQRHFRSLIWRRAVRILGSGVPRAADKRVPWHTLAQRDRPELYRILARSMGQGKRNGIFASPLALFYLFIWIDTPKIRLADIAIEPFAGDAAPDPIAAADAPDDIGLQLSDRHRFGARFIKED